MNDTADGFGDSPDSEEILQSFAPHPYQSLNIDGEIVAVNDAWLETLGYDRADVVGRWFGDFLTRESQEKFRSIFDEFKACGGVSRSEYTMKCANGEQIVVSYDGTIEYDEDGEFLRTHCQFAEITARKRRETELRQYKQAVEGSTDLLGAADMNENVLFVNEQYREYHGLSADEATNTSLEEIFGEEAVAEIEPHLQQVYDGEEVNYEMDRPGPNGDSRTLDIRYYPLRDNTGEIYGSVTAMRDITERKESERELQHLYQTYRDLVNGINDAIFVHKPDGQFLEVNEEAIQRYGYTERELLELTPADIDAPEHAAQAADRFETIEREGTHIFESVHVTKSGERIPVEISSSLIEYEGDQAVLSVARDISERKEEEQELRRMKRAVEASGHAIYITDVDGAIQYVNPAFEKVTGYSTSTALGSNPRILNSGVMPDSYFEDLWETVLGDEVWEEEVTNRRQSGDTYTAHQTIAPIHDADEELAGFVAIQTDISERKQRERELARRERMLRELHSTTQDLIEASDEEAVFDRITRALSNALSIDTFAMLAYNSAEGQLELERQSDRFGERFGTITGIAPEDNPVWTAFTEHTSRRIREAETGRLGPEWPEGSADLLIVPITDHGVVLVAPSSEETIDDVDLDLIELLVRSAEAILFRLAEETRLEDLSKGLASAKQRTDELDELIEAITRIHDRLGTVDSRAGLENAVCEEITDIHSVDFAWIGRPETREIELVPSAWAGRDSGYLDEMSFDTAEARAPSQRAATERRPVSIDRIATRAATDSWAGEALARQFNSVVSIPLHHDEVLYGVLTVYSETEAAFEQSSKRFFEGVGTVIANYLSTLNIRHADQSTDRMEVEFDIQDSNYPLHVLATKAGARIEFETVLESGESTIRLLVTVQEGDPNEVIDTAETIPSISAAEFFGKPQDGQLVLSIQKPFLAAEIVQHGGRLVESVADQSETWVRVTLPANMSPRPLAAFLKDRYPEIELRAKRETAGPDPRSLMRLSEHLTDRQLEILKAAYYGGYYDSPRGVTGEDLAESFEISNTVVHDHLRAGQKRILDRLLDTESDKQGLNN